MKSITQNKIMFLTVKDAVVVLCVCVSMLTFDYKGVSRCAAMIWQLNMTAGQWSDTWVSYFNLVWTSQAAGKGLISYNKP